MVLINGDKVADDKAKNVSWKDTRIVIPLSAGDKLKDGSIVEVITNDSISTTIRLRINHGHQNRS